MKTITISELAKLNKSNGGVFFDEDAMKAYGDTLKNFTIKRLISFPDVVRVSRKSRSGGWYFSIKTGRIIQGSAIDEMINSIR